MIAQFSQMYSRLKDEIPQGTANAIANVLMGKVMLIVVAFHVIHMWHGGIAIMQIVMHHVIAQITAESSAQDNARIS